MLLSEEVKHAALAPLEALWANTPPGNEDEATTELAHAAIAAAHEGLIAALVLVAEAIERLDRQLQGSTAEVGAPAPNL